MRTRKTRSRIDDGSIRRDTAVRDALVARLIVALNLLVKPFMKNYAHLISLPEWRCMSGLAAYPLASGEDMAQWLGVDKMSISRQLRSLERRGFASREPDPDNRRRLQWQLTPAGWEIYDQIAPAGLERDRQFLSVFSPAEAAQLRQMLDLAIAALEREAAGPDAPASRRRGGTRTQGEGGPLTRAR